MKKIIFILVICMFSQIPNLKAQLQPGECGIMFTYDATGSLIKREFICNNTGSVLNRIAKEEKTKVDSIKTANKNEIAEEEIVKVNAIMPNPTTGLFSVKLSESLIKANVMLVDAKGTVIQKSIQSGNKLRFDISNYPAGMYVVQITQGDKKFSFKILKQ